ncbi:hypothetical protein CC78DRAFT_27256 [Lojkania enalia]|uniref:Uncharacterized protein n=1 Tax=Lojkania enalia TaxID=147567 RepID=A0A9P4MZM4_9PLEO|nr:hypothetical protein CC78DRAFT_27256 [Didymosphaeria enalia]
MQDLPSGFGMPPNPGTGLTEALESYCGYRVNMRPFGGGGGAISTPPTSCHRATNKHSSSLDIRHLGMWLTLSPREWRRSAAQAAYLVLPAPPSLSSTIPHCFRPLPPLPFLPLHHAALSLFLLASIVTLSSSSSSGVFYHLTSLGAVSFSGSPYSVSRHPPSQPPRYPFWAFRSRTFTARRRHPVLSRLLQPGPGRWSRFCLPSDWSLPDVPCRTPVIVINACVKCSASAGASRPNMFSTSSTNVPKRAQMTPRRRFWLLTKPCSLSFLTCSACRR